MRNFYYTGSQYKWAFLLIAASLPALAQVPPLPLPGLPLPGSPDTNIAEGSTAATSPLPLPPNNASKNTETALPPPLALPAPPSEETAKSSPNPADMLPQAMLDKADPPKEKEDTPADANTAQSPENIASDATKQNASAKESEKSPTERESTSAETLIVPPPAPFAGAPALALPGGAAQGPMLPENMGSFGDALSTGAADLAKEASATKKTWQTTLAPSRTYPTTKFNYKRVALPSTVYRKTYSPQNRHLPVRLTRADYDRMLIAAVARNDVNGTRALLNSGRDVNQRDANGDSALIVAIRAGAYDTARLLLARGANAGFYGRGGKTAFHYARASGNNEFAKLLVKNGG